MDTRADGAIVCCGGGALSAGGGAITFSGTSQAAPHAAAVAALTLQAFPDLSVDDLEARLKSSGKPVTDDLHDSDPATNRTTPRIDARVALLVDGDDTDGDGCTNGEEYGPDPPPGRHRNPLNPWDFYDVSGLTPGVPDGVVDLPFDILSVIQHYSPTGDPPYDAQYDRGPSAGPNAWNMTAPDGVIDLANDILGVIQQFDHNCT